MTERLHAVTGLDVDDPEELSPWEHTKPRRVSEADFKRFEKNAAEMFEAFGMDLRTAGTERTPERFVRALYDATVGYEGDEKMLTAFPTECRGGADCRISQVIEGPISFHSLCEHHALPFHGVAYIGYVAHEHIIGISKLTRLVRVFARRFSVQERIGQEIADTLEQVLEPHGVAVRLQAHHLCMQMRGVREERSQTWTSNWRGSYESEPSMRQEFLDVCNSAS